MFHLTETVSRQPGVRGAAVPRGPAVRGHRVQDRQPRVGVLVQARLPLPLPQQHLPAVVPLQALPLPPVAAAPVYRSNTIYINSTCFIIHPNYIDG